MITIKNDSLDFRFDHVHKDARCSIEFERTLRIPDDNSSYPLPPSLGSFPLQHVDDFSHGLPSSWSKHGGVFFPMFQAEAMWLNFSCGEYPFAVLIAAGKVNAVNGETWNGGKLSQEQNYVVLPEQPWLDGFSVTEGHVRQFVAMPLGQGFTAEEQLTGAAEHGGLQVVVVPMKRELYIQKFRDNLCEDQMQIPSNCSVLENLEMGLAPGGLMRQSIDEDPHGLDAWDMDAAVRCFVHIANSEQYEGVTGSKPSQKSVSAEDYTAAGMPWFEYYSENPSVAGSPALSGLDSVAATSVKQGQEPTAGGTSVSKININTIGEVRQGDW